MVPMVALKVDFSLSCRKTEFLIRNHVIMSRSISDVCVENFLFCRTRKILFLLELSLC